MPKYNIKLIGRKEIASGTMMFTFEKPDGFTYKAGQCASFTLIEPTQTDAEGNNRTFPLANHPYENELMIATRMRNTAFKRELKTMPLGTIVELKGPYSSFNLHSDPEIPAVYLSDGIGITQ